MDASARQSVRALLLKASNGDSADLESYLESGGTIPPADQPWLAEVLRRLRLGKGRGAPSGPRLPSHGDEKNRKLAELCAAYLVRCCVDNHRWATNKPTPRPVLESIEKRALKIVHEHFAINRDLLRTGDIIGKENSGHSLYERTVHGDICIMVHRDLHEPLENMLRWHAEAYLTPQK